MPSWSHPRRHFALVAKPLRTNLSGRLDELTCAVKRDQKRYGVTDERRLMIERGVEAYAASTKSDDVTPDLKLAITRILMARYPGPRRPPAADPGNGPSAFASPAYAASAS